MFSRGKVLWRNHSYFGLIINPLSPPSSPFVLLKPIHAERHNLSRKLILNTYYNFSNGKISPKLNKVCHQETQNHIYLVNNLTKSDASSQPCSPALRNPRWARSFTARGGGVQLAAQHALGAVQGLLRTAPRDPGPVHAPPWKSTTTQGSKGHRKTGSL